MFDDRLVFETPGKLPGIVRTDNIRHTHFSRNTQKLPRNYPETIH